MSRIKLIVLIVVILAVAVGGAVFFVNRRRGSRLLIRAQMAVKAQKPDRALEMVDEHIAEKPDDWRGHCLRGEILNSTGQYAKARVSLQRAVELAPSRAKTHISLSRTHSARTQSIMASGSARPETAQIRQAIDALTLANGTLSKAKISDLQPRLDIQEEIGLNRIRKGMAWRRLANRFREEAKQAGAESRRAGDDAAKKARSRRKESRAADVSSAGEYKEGIKTLQEVIDADISRSRAAESLVRNCLDTKNRAALSDARATLLGFSEPLALLGTDDKDLSEEKAARKKGILAALPKMDPPAEAVRIVVMHEVGPLNRSQANSIRGACLASGSTRWDQHVQVALGCLF